MGITTLRKRHNEPLREEGVTKAVNVVEKKLSKPTKKTTKKSTPKAKKETVEK